MSDELKEEVKAKVLQYIAGSRLETNKLEFKRKWYELKEDRQKNEFYKDTTALINSFGGDDAFIVFGVDEDKTLHESRLTDCGYKDAADLKNIIDSNIDKPFRFNVDYIHVNGIQLSVMHLQPSTDKPHVILKYTKYPKDKQKDPTVHENEIFTRSGSAKVAAGKADLDRMYIERNTIIVERKAELSTNLTDINLTSYRNSKGKPSHSFRRQVAIENRGTRPLIIYQVILQLKNSQGLQVNFSHDVSLGSPIIIEPNDVAISKDMAFDFIEEEPFPMNIDSYVLDVATNLKVNSISAHLVLATGEVLHVNLFQPNINLAPDGLGILWM